MPANSQVELLRRFVAHDIKAPLVRLQRDFEFLDAEIAVIADEATPEWLRKLKSGVQKVGFIVEGLYDEQDAQQIFELVGSDDLAARQRFMKFTDLVFENVIDCCDRLVRVNRYVDERRRKKFSEILSRLEKAEDGLFSLRHTLIDFRRMQKANFNSNDRIDVEKLIRDRIRSRKYPKKVKFETNITNGDGELIMTGNRLHFDFLLRQTVSNSIKYTQRPKPKIYITAKLIKAVPKALSDEIFPTLQHGPLIYLRVSDNGIGISKDTLANIKRKLRQGDPINEEFSQNYSGTGMGAGLTICRNVVELYGGRIAIKSSPGRGTSVYFLIPQAKRANND